MPFLQPWFLTFLTEAALRHLKDDVLKHVSGLYCGVFYSVYLWKAMFIIPPPCLITTSGCVRWRLKWDLETFRELFFNFAAGDLPKKHCARREGQLFDEGHSDT